MGLENNSEVTEAKPQNGSQGVEDGDILTMDKKIKDQFEATDSNCPNTEGIEDENKVIDYNNTENDQKETTVKNLNKDHTDISFDNKENKNDLDSTNDEESNEEIGYKKKRGNLKSKTSNLSCDSEEESDSCGNEKLIQPKKNRLKKSIDSSDEEEPNSDDGDTEKPNQSKTNHLKKLIDSSDEEDSHTDSRGNEKLGKSKNNSRLKKSVDSSDEEDSDFDDKKMVYTENRNKLNESLNESDSEHEKEKDKSRQKEKGKSEEKNDAERTEFQGKKEMSCSEDENVEKTQEKINNDSDNELGFGNNEKDEKEGKKKNVGRLKKNELKEMKSEQQRMLRERRCEIPYHEPKAKSVKEFLKRVPTLSNRRTKSLPNSGEASYTSDGNTISLTGSAKKKSLFDLKPILKHDATSGDLEFVDTSDVVVVTGKAPPIRKTNPLDKFMKKVEKQMVKKTPSKEKVSTVENITITNTNSAEKIKSIQGTCHTQLKSKLKEKIRQTRHQQYSQLQSQRDKLEEQIALEEESFGEDEMDLDDDDEQDSDEEVDKWNCDEKRIRLEESMAEENEKEDKEEENEAHEDSIDFNINESTKESSSLKEKDGNVSTQLLKSNLLDTCGNAVDEKKTLFLPCENTQDLYESESRVSSDSNSEAELGPNFRLSLDEDTQYTQSMLDSQGFFKNKKEKESTPTIDKKIFSDDLNQTESMSMTQMLGLCSGKFGGDTSDDVRTSQKKGVANRSLNFSLGFDQSFDAVPFFKYSSGTADNSTQESGKKLTSNLSEAILEAKNITQKITKLDEKGVPNSQGFSSERKDTATVEAKNLIRDGMGNVEANENKDKKEEEIDVKEQEGDEKDEMGEVDENVGDLENDEQAEDGDDESENDEAGSENEEEENAEYEEEGEDGTGDYEEEEEDVPEELKEWNMHMTNEKNEKKKKKWKKKAFYEEEAELSGSDVGSDDEDLGSEYDEYEIDSEAELDVHSGEKLKKQLHKIHQRKMNDQDKQEMRLLQELYLEDGELGGGEKRKRNFRWRNIDENFNENSKSYEVDEADNYAEMKEKNLELVKRNKFLMEQDQENDIAIELDENSQMILEKIQAISGQKSVASSQPLSAIDVSQITTKVPFRRSGSFLRGSDFSQSPSSVPTVSKAVGKSAKSFVYQSLEDKPKSKKTKKELGEDAIPSLPPSKKQKLNNNNSNDELTNNKRRTAPSSIFSHL